MKKEKENPNYHMGKQTGYELINGEYHIAPLYVEQFNALMDKKQGIETMLKIVASHAAKDLEEIHKAKQRIYQDLSEDIGIDLKEQWTYSNGVIKRVESP